MLLIQLQCLIIITICITIGEVPVEISNYIILRAPVAYILGWKGIYFYMMV